MAGTPAGGNPVRRGVTFGPLLSPEIFDTELPSNTPVKRGCHHDEGMVVDEDFGRIATGENVAARMHAAMEEEMVDREVEAEVEKIVVEEEVVKSVVDEAEPKSAVIESGPSGVWTKSGSGRSWAPSPAAASPNPAAGVPSSPCLMAKTSTLSAMKPKPLVAGM
jgi:hypothetical protein